MAAASAVDPSPVLLALDRLQRSAALCPRMVAVLTLQRALRNRDAPRLRDILSHSGIRPDSLRRDNQGPHRNCNHFCAVRHRELCRSNARHTRKSSGSKGEFQNANGP